MILIGLGSNLGARSHNLWHALRALSSRGVRILNTSHMYQTPPFQPDLSQGPQADYLNAVVQVQTHLSPTHLMHVLHDIEQQLGRKHPDQDPNRNIPNRTVFPARTLDLDLLFYHDLCTSDPKLHIPHPRLHQRPFVLLPLMDVAPQLTHPALGKTVTQLSQTIPTIAKVLPFLAKSSQPFRVGSKTLLMGVVNCTPDSFSDGGLYCDSLQNTLQAVASMMPFADIIDVGGQSTRPGAELVPLEQELQRVVPVISALRKQFPQVVLSVDTFRAKVAEESILAGADIVNDVSFGRADEHMFEVVVKYDVGYIGMHSRGTARNMQTMCEYEQGVVKGVCEELDECVQLAVGAGIPLWNIMVDPGLGFAKTASQSLSVLRRLDEIKIRGCGMLVGPSRKSFLQSVGAPENAQDRDWSTAAAVCASISGGADIIRVHNCRAMSEVSEAYQGIVRG